LNLKFRSDEIGHWKKDSGAMSSAAIAAQKARVETPVSLPSLWNYPAVNRRSRGP
jgi:hypothetical protein